MNQNILQILEFNEIRKMLTKFAPSFLSKERAMHIEPSTDYEEIANWLDQTEEASICLEKEISSPLGETYNIIKFLQKADKDIILLPQEFMELSASLETYQKMHHYFEGERHLLYPLLEKTAGAIVPQDDFIRKIHQIFDEKGEISDHASPKLSRIRSDMEILRGRIRRVFQNILRDKNQSSYFQDMIVTQRNNRYVIPVKEEYRYRFDGIVHDRSSTGQTLFMEPMSSVQLNNDLAELILAERQEIHEILQNLTAQVKKQKSVIKKNCETATEIEFIFARASLALSMKGTKAVHSDHNEMILNNARHPLIPDEKVVPISLTLGKNFKILIITGSNAGGKTIAIKTAGLLALMNQSGLFIPASEGSILPVYKNIYSIIGDEQSIQFNLSTFSSYISQLVSFLPTAGKNDLVLLDELGSGTDPIEGAALAQSVTEYLDKREISSIITSHFSEMKKMAYEKDTIENAFVEFDLETLSPTYHLITGVAGNSNAFNICKRMGIPAEIINRADELQRNSPLYHMEKVMENLNQQMQEIEREKISISATLKEAEQLHDDLNKEMQYFLKKKDSILEKTRIESENIKRELRIQSEQIIKDLKRERAEFNNKEFHKYVEGIRNAVDSMNIPEVENRKEPLDIKEVKIGKTVYVDTLGNEGEIVSFSGNKITVNFGIANVTVDISHCFLPDDNIKISQKKEPEERRTYSTFRHDAVSTSINVIGKTVDDAIPDIDRFLNDCFMAGISPIQIIHGKGTGALRKGIQSYLKTLNYIKDFKSAEPQNGGDGVTDVYF